MSDGGWSKDSQQCLGSHLIVNSCAWWCWWIKVNRSTKAVVNVKCYSAVSSRKLPLCFTSTLPHSKHGREHQRPRILMCMHAKWVFARLECVFVLIKLQQYGKCVCVCMCVTHACAKYKFISLDEDPLTHSGFLWNGEGEWGQQIGLAHDADYLAITKGMSLWGNAKRDKRMPQWDKSQSQREHLHWRLAYRDVHGGNSIFFFWTNPVRPLHCLKYMAHN